MTNNQRGAVIGVGAAYAVAIALLVVTRNVLHLSELGQFAISTIGPVVALMWATSRLGPLRWRSGRRTGGRLIANFLVLFTAMVVMITAQGSMPTDWPVVGVGVIFPFLLVGQLAIDWRQLGDNAPSV